MLEIYLILISISWSIFDILHSLGGIAVFPYDPLIIASEFILAQSYVHPAVNNAIKYVLHPEA